MHGSKAFNNRYRHFIIGGFLAGQALPDKTMTVFHDADPTRFPEYHDLKTQT
jgi:hypothetical protein